jgi:O-antigen/teichoic acid export membrane protein
VLKKVSVEAVRQFLTNNLRSTLARNSGWMFLGFGLRIVVQAGYFILIARALGPQQYGAFVGVVALVSIIAPFATMGSGNLLVKNVSRDRSLFSEYWGNSLFMTVVSAVPLLGVMVGVAHFVLPVSIPRSLILLIGVSDLLFMRISDVAAQAFQAVDQMRYTAKLSLLPNLLRLIGAVIIFVCWHRVSAPRWAWFYLGSTLICAVIAILLTNYKLGFPKLALWRIRGQFVEGFYFGASLSAQTVYNDIDKMMLARLSTLDATGIYGAAYRLIDVAFAPVRSVLYAAYPNFFRHGQEGITNSFAYAKRILPRVTGYSVFAFLALFVAAPIIPCVIGSEFARTVEALRWLALLPLLKTIHYFFADSLTGAGHQGVRTACQIGVAAINVVLNFWLIPAYSLRGAAWASIASDGLLALAVGTALLVLCRRSVLAKGRIYESAVAATQS